MQRRSSLVLAIAFASGCYTGLSASDRSSAADADASATLGDDDGGSTDAGDDGAAEEVPAPTLRRLTAAEFTHSVHDLLGPVAIAAIEADAELEGFFSVGAAQIALSPAGVALYETALDQATSEAFADPANVAAIVSCVPASSADTGCMRDSIATFGRRAWRRPLSDADVDRYLAIATAVATETGDGVLGLRHAIWGLLQSPYFLYRVELGTPSPDDPNRLVFGPYELASRLSFTLWNTLPDDALLDAAGNGGLDDPDGIRGQAERMLADPRARQGVDNFVGELYALWTLDEKTKDATLFPEWTPTLKAVMRDELLARVRDVVFDTPADFFTLYDGTKVFVNNELARLYGLPEVDPDAFRPALVPEDGARRGLVGSALVLAMNSLPARTSATERGAFISEILLCRTVPPPPPNVDTNLDDDDDGTLEPRTLREKLEPHRADPVCAACHQMTDPLGLALEHFDTIGRYRETDQGLTIDASGELDGVPFADGAELATVLRDHPDVSACLVRKLYTYTAGRVPFPSEADLVAALEGELGDADNHFDRLLFALVTHDDFRYANPDNSVIASEGGMP